MHRTSATPSEVLAETQEPLKLVPFVAQAEAWRWGSQRRRTQGTAEERALLSPWPVPRPRSWPQLVNEPQHETELRGLRKCVARGQPYGSPAWVQTTATQLGLQATLRPRGRPRKTEENPDS